MQNVRRTRRSCLCRASGLRGLRRNILENLLLEADELGLGAVWMGISPDEGRMKAVREVLDIPEDLHAFALVPCGYPAEERAQEDRYEESRVHYIMN